MILELENKEQFERLTILSDVKSFGISTPLIHFVDYKNFSISMQYVKGKLIRDMDEKSIPKICLQIGKIVGKLHQNGIMHGDLTTSNFILASEHLFVIDFGLANRTEKPDDHAVDLRLFKEILNSAHASVMEKSWKNFISGYEKSVGPKYCKKILELVSVIESRGRYATVV